MSYLTEADAERLLVRRAFVPAPPGFVGARIGVAGTTLLADGRHRLRHGHLQVRAGRATLSVPPSPGVDLAIRRATEDLALARELVGAPTGPPPTTTVTAEPGTTGVRVALEAGTAGTDPRGYRYRWTLAHSVGPVLHALFGAPPVATVPPPVTADPRSGWAATVLDAVCPDGRTFRDWTRSQTDRPTAADLDAHIGSLTVPVRARGHLELDAAGDLPADAWAAPVAVATVLLDDERAAAEANAATRLLYRPGTPSPWTRAARTGLADPELAGAARICLFAAYDALTRHGASRQVRDALAALAGGDPFAPRSHRRVAEHQDPPVRHRDPH